jgi:hypothetical protein
MRYDLFELSVAVPSKHGTSKIPEYGHKGLTFVEGRRGQPYSLKLRNDSAQRVLAVVTIDGLNVVDGQPCTPKSRGYIVPAYSSVDIDGWRTSLAEVHQFKFEAKDGSYAKSTTGEVQNCGIISAKFFSEKPAPIPQTILQPYRVVEEHHHHHYHDLWPHVRPWRYPTWPEIWYTTCQSSSAGIAGNVGPSGPAGETLKCATSLGQYSVGSGMTAQYTASNAANVTCSVNMMANAAPLTQADVPDFKLGTGWGEAKADSVSEVAFEREKELCTLAIYYAENADLEKVGIQLAKDIAVTPPPTPVLPQAFSGFCKPPVSR